jgi:excisionase family DNA binding protein
MTDDATQLAEKRASDGIWRDGASSISDAAIFLSLSRRTIYELMSDGKLPSRKLRGRRLIPRAALLDLLSSADG